MGLKNNKKAMFFTLIAILLLSIFILGYGVYSLGNNRKTIDRRIGTMNDYVFSLEKDLPRKLYISGFRVIFLCEKKIVETGVPINNISQVFEEAFYNGTIYGEPQIIMQGARFSDIIKDVNLNAESINLNVSIVPKKLSISHDDPWNVKVTLEADVAIIDRGNLAMWNKSEIIQTYIPIENFEDPLYVLYLNETLTNKINKTIYNPLVNGNDVSNLTSHNENSYYISSSLAPSFLDRLEGKFTANPNGIESLIYLPRLSSIKDKSCVDYIYFSPSNPPSYRIQGMPSWFKIDDAHLDIYNVSGLVI